MKLRLLVLTIFALLLTLVIPVAADAASGDSWWQQKCPDGFMGPDRDGNCTRVTHEEIDAEEIIHYYCEAPYQGPNKDNQCVKHHVDIFPADPTYEYKCPDGYEGPVDKLCTKKVTKIDTVHVDEVTTEVCPDGWSLDSGICSLTIPEVTTTPSGLAQEFSCPVGYAGPDAANQCVRTIVEVDTIPGVVTVTELCPTDFTIESSNCVKTVDDKLFAGVNVTVDLACPAELVFGSAGCTATVPAKTIVSCPAGFTLNDSNGTDYPGICEMESDEEPVILSLECPAPLTNLQPIAGMLGMGTCDSVSSPTEVATFACPTGFVLSGVSDTLCERTIETKIAVPPISVTEVSCADADYLGPDANGDCTRTTVTDEVIDATVTEVAVCGADEVGPDANGDCLIIGTIEITTPAIDLPSFTCPAGYDGPDEKWNCTKEVTEIEEIDADKHLTGYSCPSDARGPNKDHLCARDDIKKVDASEHVSYICPKDTHGAKDGKCVRKTIEVVPALGSNCTIKFYDYPNAQKFLFSVSDDGEANLDGPLANYNNDVESILVPRGCTISVGQKFNNASGWCGTFGAGVHNLPDDQLSWFAIPGMGCNNW